MRWHLGFVAAWVAVLWAAFSTRALVPPSLQAAVRTAASTAPGHSQAEAAFRIGADRPASHASHLSVGADGGLRVLWFSGSREGAKDVAIRQASWNGQAWSAPQDVLTRSVLEWASARNVRKLGNPVSHTTQAPNAEHLFVTSVSLGGWAGARIEHLRPALAEAVWQRSLVLSPFLNISTLVRAPAVDLAGGGFALPVYHEFLRKAPELLVFSSDGRLQEKRRGMGAVGELQPVVLAQSSGFAVWSRNENAQTGQLQRWAYSGAGAALASPTNVPNRDTGLALQVLPDGRTVLAHNPAGRDQLVLSVSKDGLSFAQSLVLDAKPSSEFSYPSLALHGGDLWVSYTAERKAIALRRIDWRSL